MSVATRDDRRDRILDAGRDILEREGAKALTIRRLAEAIDRTQPAIYAHFASKDALLEELIGEGFVALHEALAAAARSARGSKLLAVSKAYIAFGTVSPHVYEAMFVGETTVEFAAGARTPAPAHAAFDVLRDACCGNERRSTDAADDDTRTEVFWAALHGLVMLANKHRLRRGERIAYARVLSLVAAFDARPETR